MGVPYVWIIDPEKLGSELRRAGSAGADRTLRIAGSPMLTPLREVMEE